ncbi:MAG: hypothetical protein Q4F84_08530, partial [Fibrobacter sp.]|nr:hypothetical protein [Fibrobacter sp.]
MEKKIILIKDTGAGSDSTSDIQSQFTKAIFDIGAQESIQAVRAADLGVYNRGVAVKVMPGDVVYVQVKPENVAEIVDAVSKDEVVDSLVLKNRVAQTRIVLRNCGIIDPESIEDYMSTGGYTSVAKCLLD